jgi:hypothetical protein
MPVAADAAARLRAFSRYRVLRRNGLVIADAAGQRESGTHCCCPWGGACRAVNRGSVDGKEKVYGSIRKGALVDKRIRTIEQGLGANPGPNRALEWNTLTGEPAVLAPLKLALGLWGEWVGRRCESHIRDASSGTKLAGRQSLCSRTLPHVRASWVGTIAASDRV